MGNRAVVFALESLGFEVWSVPTVVLSWHPGHGPTTKIVPDPNQFARMMKELADSPWISGVGAVLSGYLGCVEQVDSVRHLVNAVKSANPAAKYLCDPVIGDRGRLYVSEGQASGIRDRLIPIADIITPNLFELGWISQCRANDFSDIAKACSKLDRPVSLVTSVDFQEGRTGNMLVNGDALWFAHHKVIADIPNGPGDLTAAVFLAQLFQLKEPVEALNATTASVLDIITEANRTGRDELALHANHRFLINPRSRVVVERISETPA